MRPDDVNQDIVTCSQWTPVLVADDIPGGEEADGVCGVRKDFSCSIDTNCHCVSGDIFLF